MSIIDIDWSPAQDAIINADDERILVSASAGSGKTTVMIGRIMRLLLGGAKLENMLICTFTKASAADMRAKLYRELNECCMKSGLSSEVKNRLRAELKSLSRADISTIDSFCQRIVSRYFYMIGVDPQFEVLDDSDSKALKLKAVEESIAKTEGLDELKTVLRRKRSLELLSKTVLALMDYNSINPIKATYDYDADAVKREIDKRLSDAAGRLERATDDVFGGMDEPEKYAAFISSIRTGIADFSAKKLKKESEIYKPVIDYLKEKIRDFCKLKAESRQLRAQSESAGLIEGLLSLERRASELYAKEKAKRSALDFADLEVMALDILKAGGKEITAKYRYVFVDEYQDINPLQESLIQTVSDGNNLFMVGDLKQSIYAFRGCEPQFFKAKYDLYSQGVGGRAFNLDCNYRSGKKIIEMVNGVFERVMTRDFGGADYKNNPMTTLEKAEDGYVRLNGVHTAKVVSAPAHGVYSVEHHVNERANITPSEAEADLVVARLLELIKSGVKFGDIAILTRKMGSLEECLIEKFKELNIPLSLSERAKYLLRNETRLLIEFMRLIDNRKDDKALFITMLSPFGGFNETELAELKTGKGHFYECVEGAIGTNSKVTEFYERLDRYYRLSLTMGADELCDLIVSESGYFNYAYSLGEDAAEVLDRFLEYLGGCPCKNVLSECIKYIDEHDPYTELNGSDNSVRLLTVHKSKGLEFDYVFVIGLSKSFTTKDTSKEIYVGGEVAMQVYDDHKIYESDLHFLQGLDIDRRQKEEELRINYVAFTRARKGLELFGQWGTKDPAGLCGVDIIDYSQVKSVMEWLGSVPMYGYGSDEVHSGKADAKKVFFSKPDEELVRKISDYFEFKPERRAPVKSYVSKLAHNDDEPATYIVTESSGGEERGSAYHRALERIDFSSPDLGVVSEEDMKLIDGEKLLTAAKAMLRFDGKFYREKPFMLRLSALEAGVEGSGDILVQGVIDLLIIDGDNATVVDYKTGKAHGGFEEGYFKQVNLYGLAVERLLGKKVVGKFLYYIDEKIFVEVE